MRLHADDVIVWDIVIWQGRGQLALLCCPRALVHDDEAGRSLPPCPHATCPGRPTVTLVDDPDVYVRVMRDHDLGDCDERYQRIR